jgi:arylsulfatase
MGMSQLDPSIGGLLKNLGYATGQFGKNHVGDRNESLPTVNGFDEFFGNLYHLNAEEEPELPDYPKDPAFKARWGPRGVLRCKATDRDDPTVDPRFVKVGKQTIEDTGALTKKRMETIDDETSAAAIDFMKRQQATSKPFFCWFNSTRMHLRTHVRAGHRGRYKHGDSEYIDGMIEHDETIGSILKALDDMGIANNTIVVYSSDNGPHMNTWPDGAMTHFRSEKNTNWEGAFRVPCLARWPGHIKPGTITNELMSHNDWIPTLCAIAGEPDIVNKCRAGYTANGINYKVHLDGYDQSKFLTSVEGTATKNNGIKSARNTYHYSDDDGLLVGMRNGDYKASFAEQRLPGTMGVWAEPFTVLRLTKLYNLMQDPFERADITSNTYWDWIINHVPQVYQGMEEVTTFVASFKEFPPRSVPPSFNPANMMEDTLRDIKAKQKFERAFPMLIGPAKAPQQ